VGGCVADVGIPGKLQVHGHRAEGHFRRLTAPLSFHGCAIRLIMEHYGTTLDAQPCQMYHMALEGRATEEGGKDSGQRRSLLVVVGGDEHDS
jgi:hypothetical protein